MILYIAPESCRRLFDDYCDRENVYLEHLPLESAHPLKMTLSRYQSLSNFNHVVFYFEEEPEWEELRDAVEFLKRFHHTRITVFSPSSAATYRLFGQLSRLDVRELVAVDDGTVLEDELERCISYEGAGFLEAVTIQQTAQIAMVREYVRPDLPIPEDYALTVAVAGTQHRTGVTTQAFSIYHALRYLGFRPCIVDTGQAFIGELLNLYEEESVVEGSVVSIREMDFASAVQVGTGHNAFIYDCGVLTEQSMADFSSCDLRFLCAGTKAWELPHLVTALAGFPGAAQQILFSFASKREEKEAETLVGGLLPVSFAPWFPDIWNLEERVWHEEFLIPLVKAELGL